MSILKHLKTGTLLGFVLVGAVAAPVAAQPGADDALIDKIFAAYGERRQVLSVRSYRMEATLRARSRGQEADVVRIAQGPSRLKVLIRYPDSVEIRVLDGERAWRGAAAHDLVPVQGPLRGAIVLQAARAALPWVLAEPGTKTLPSLASDGAPILEIALGEGMVLRVITDPKTYRIVRSLGTLRMGASEIQFETRYSDFRAVDGVRFAFHEENYASGTHTGTTIVKRIQLNPAGSGLQLFGK